MKSVNLYQLLVVLLDVTAKETTIKGTDTEKQ